MRESDLLSHIYQSNPALPGSVAIPPGDDMGAVTIDGCTVLVTTDQLADGVHVDLPNTPLEKVGRKAITRSLSDVAAMAAKPVGAVVAACLPRDMNEAQAQQLFDTMRRTGEQYGCPLVGGDIAMWDGKLLATVTIFAEPAGIEPVLRSGAQVGDAICVTGQLGGSVESGHHLDFEPRIDAARQLAGNPKTRPHSMIDLSDGLGRDLAHLCEHAEIDADALPRRTPSLDWKNIVGDGEDYELLFTITPDAVLQSVAGVTITRIGTVTDSGGVVMRLPDGKHIPLHELGWEHAS